MTLPLQTGSAIIGARVLSDDAGVGRRRARRGGGARQRARARSWRRRPSAHPDVHVNIVVHVGRRWSRTRPRRPAARRVVGGEMHVHRRLGAAGERRRRARDPAAAAATAPAAEDRLGRPGRLLAEKTTRFAGFGIERHIQWYGFAGAGGLGSLPPARFAGVMPASPAPGWLAATARFTRRRPAVLAASSVPRPPRTQFAA